MCGIHAYIGAKQANATEICLQGLELLEYRGYDSSGIAGILDGKIRACKRTGKVELLKAAIAREGFPLQAAIAHTRWATHGAPNQENAHPQLDEKKTLAVVHNGIIENYLALREKLTAQGVKFESDTDSEVIAQLISYHYRGNLRIAVAKAMRELCGSLAIAVIHIDHPHEIVAASRESPLVVGLDLQKSASYVSSDANSFSGKSLRIVYLDNDEVASVTWNQVKVYSCCGKNLKKKDRLIQFTNSLISKNGFDHFMLKEIFEQPQTIKRAMENRLGFASDCPLFSELKLSCQDLQKIDRIVILGCGTSWHAGYIAGLLFEEIARIPTEVKIASEFRYTNPLISENTLVITVSQSGETADTIAAMRQAKRAGAKVLALCNVPYSTMTREATSSLFLQAGPEVSVCSTKAFTSQLTVLSLLAISMANQRHLSEEEKRAFVQQLKQLPIKVTQVLSHAKTIASFANTYSQFTHFFFLGRRYMYPTSLEAALKLKEISYLHATGYPAGEMKHGPLALIAPNVAVVGLCGNEQTLDKMVSNLMEVKARGGQILLFAPKGNSKLRAVTSDIIDMPHVADPFASIIYSVATQLFAYYIAKTKNTDIDHPRHLAKSVTVE